jgi:hypothetical protein
MSIMIIIKSSIGIHIIIIAAPAVANAITSKGSLRARGPSVTGGGRERRHCKRACHVPARRVRGHGFDPA